MAIEIVPSIEGAYDKAIESSARMIQLANRPETNMGRKNGADDMSEIQEESSTTGSSNDSSMHKRSDDGTCNGSLDYDTGSEHDSIESNIIFLKEKTQILKKALSIRKNEEAYVAFYAYKILNDQHERPSSSVWYEAKDIVDECKSGDGGDINASLHNEKHRRSPLSLQQHGHNLSSSEAEAERLGGNSHRRALNKRHPKIDLSSVEHVSSNQFDNATNNVDSNATFCDISARNICRQAHAMQLATDSRNWISHGVLTDILSLTKTLAAKYRLSLMTKTTMKKRKRE